MQKGEILWKLGEVISNQSSCADPFCEYVDNDGWGECDSQAVTHIMADTKMGSSWLLCAEHAIKIYNG